ncbi:MAG: VWA domain-containing protein, partial [Mariprofundales bacterium]
NFAGHLGDGTILYKSNPVAVTDAAGNAITGIKSVSAGAHHTVALKADGTLLDWGYNVYGQLGDGTLVNKSNPVAVTDAAGNAITGVARLMNDMSAFTPPSSGVSLIQEGSLQTSPPASQISFMFHAQDSYSGAPLAHLEARDFVVLENGTPIGLEQYFDVQRRSELPFTIQTVLMLDVSSSMAQAVTTQAGVLSKLELTLQAARDLVLDPYGNNLLRDEEQVAIYVFDGQVRMVQDFTHDARQLAAAISGIQMQLATVNSTNLYGAIATGMGRLSGGYSLNNMVQGQMVLITDGMDTAGLITENTALNSIGNNLFYVLGVGAGVDAAALQRLTSNYTQVADFTQVSNALEATYQAMDDLANSFYVFTYNTPLKAGTANTVQLTIANNSNTAADASVSGIFDASNITQTAVPELIIKGSSEMALGDTMVLTAFARMLPASMISYAWSSDNYSVASLFADTYSARLTAKTSGIVNVAVRHTLFANLQATHKVFIGNIALQGLTAQDQIITA